MELDVDNATPSKTFIEIVIGMEERDEPVASGLMVMYGRELDGFTLNALRETVDYVSKLFPRSKRLLELNEKIRYREQNGLVDGGM